MGGKRNKEQQVYINNAIRKDLLWALTHLENSDGVHLFKSISWTPSQASYTVYCDACPEGLGFWYPDSKEGYYAPTPVIVPSGAIFYYEALCVLSALDHVQSKAQRGSKILLYTDNVNTVDIFRSLHCLLPYNQLLKSAVDILIQKNYSLHVLHVPGEQNIVANALSRVHFSVALHQEPNLKFFTFNPPQYGGVCKMIQSGLRSRQPARIAWP